MQSIVIVGGGFAGLNAALAAARVAENRIFITLVSREPWLTVRPRLYEADPQSLRADLLGPLGIAGVRFVAAEAKAVTDGHLVASSREALAFDRLIVATGSVMARPEIPGAASAYSIDDMFSAIAFDERLAVLSRQLQPTVIVIGAGFTGIELALELRDRITEHGGAATGEAARIHLVDRSAGVGHALGDGPRSAIEGALRDAGVDTHLGATIASIDPDQVTLDDGRIITADAVVLCTGLRAAPFALQIGGTHDKRGRLLTDPYLRVAGAPTVFAAGDSAVAIPAPGRETLMSCQHALTLGKFAGENAARDVLGLPLVPYAQPRYVTCLALGRSGAVYCEGWERTPKADGEKGRAIKTEINTRRIYPPTGTRAEILASTRID